MQVTEWLTPDRRPSLMRSLRLMPIWAPPPATSHACTIQLPDSAPSEGEDPGRAVANARHSSHLPNQSSHTPPVCADERVHAHKARTAMTHAERFLALRPLLLHCRYVDHVLPSAPWVIDPGFIAELQIDYVAQDDACYAAGSTEDVYAYVKRWARRVWCCVFPGFLKNFFIPSSSFTFTYLLSPFLTLSLTFSTCLLFSRFHPPRRHISLPFTPSLSSLSCPSLVPPFHALISSHPSPPPSSHPPPLSPPGKFIPTRPSRTSGPPTALECIEPNNLIHARRV
ncbi:hypothetical protein JB92DRAFT_3148953 [Gautieria morchelliformis]|nr:hypothetical protein JB92DRAFT_3148953 [Gautieria morchelliformis]